MVSKTNDFSFIFYSSSYQVTKSIIPGTLKAFQLYPSKRPRNSRKTQMVLPIGCLPPKWDSLQDHSRPVTRLHYSPTDEPTGTKCPFQVYSGARQCLKAINSQDGCDAKPSHVHDSTFHAIPTLRDSNPLRRPGSLTSPVLSVYQ